MAGAVLERVVKADVSQVGAVRRATREFLTDGDAAFQESLLLVVSELATNAVEALHNPAATFTFRLREFADRVEIEVEDGGPGFGSALNRPGSSDADPRGRGLAVVRLLVDDFAVRRRYGKTVVCCTLYRRRGR